MTEGLGGLVLLPEEPKERPASADPVAVAALATGVVGLAPVAIVLGFVGLARTKRPGVSGRRFAQVGLALGALWSVAFAAILVFAILLGHRVAGSLTATPDKGPVSLAQDSTTKSGSEVEHGDCLLAWNTTTLTGETDPDVVTVDCRSPHQAQAFGAVDLSDTYADGAAYPGPAAIIAAGSAGCRNQVSTALVPGAAQIAVSAIPPTAQDWTNGSRSVICLTVSGAADLTSSLTT